jgi:hypothetical protein
MTALRPGRILDWRHLTPKDLTRKIPANVSLVRLFVTKPIALLRLKINLKFC